MSLSEPGVLESFGSMVSGCWRLQDSGTGDGTKEQAPHGSSKLTTEAGRYFETGTTCLRGINERRA
jgi:hypothetical protein